MCYNSIVEEYPKPLKALREQSLRASPLSFFKELIYMPYKSKIACAHSGCRELSDSNLCHKHRREEPRAFMYNRQWQKARSKYLKANPLCTHCLKLGKFTPADVVDHIIPHRGDVSTFWDKDNWQPLCTSCHNRKTATTDMYIEFG